MDPGYLRWRGLGSLGLSSQMLGLFWDSETWIKQVLPKRRTCATTKPKSLKVWNSLEIVDVELPIPFYRKYSTVESRPFPFRIFSHYIFLSAKFAKKKTVFAIDWLANLLTCQEWRRKQRDHTGWGLAVWMFSMYRKCWRRMGKTNGRRGPHGRISLLYIIWFASHLMTKPWCCWRTCKHKMKGLVSSELSKIFLARSFPCLSSFWTLLIRRQMPSFKKYPETDTATSCVELIFRQFVCVHYVWCRKVYIYIYPTCSCMFIHWQ